MLHRARSLAAKLATDSNVTDGSGLTRSHGESLGSGISASAGTIGKFRDSGELRSSLVE